jgi:hypothetical protein
MAATDWTALRCLATVALERSNQPTYTKVVDERDIVSGHADAEKCGVCPRFFSFQVVFNALESRLYPSSQAMVAQYCQVMGLSR